MEMAKGPKDRFRHGFVLVMTIVFAIAFFVLIGMFFKALVLAAVFSGICYPLYDWLRQKFGGRKTAASMVTLGISILAILIPVIFLLGLVGEQALGVSDNVSPWIEQQINKSQTDDGGLPSWFPLRERLEPHSDQVKAKLAQITGKAGAFLAGSLAKLSQGTAVFFFHLFVMLYAMAFFLVNGRETLDTILGYFPLSEADKKKMVEVGLSVSRATLKGTLVIGIVQGALGGLGFAVAGIEAAVFWGAVMAVLSVIPGLGTAVVWIPGVAFLLMGGHTVAGIGLLVWCAGVVSSVDNVLRPILVGRDTEMPDLLILLSTLGGLAMFGASGLILGPVLAALFLTVLAIYSRVFCDWLRPDELPEDPSTED